MVGHSRRLVTYLPGITGRLEDAGEAEHDWLSTMQTPLRDPVLTETQRAGGVGKRHLSM